MWEVRKMSLVGCGAATTISATYRITLALISAAAISAAIVAAATITTAHTAGFAGSMFVEFFCEGFCLRRIDDDDIIHAR